MAQDGFSSGLQQGLGMFNAMQNMSYQQQMLQNRDEDQAQRKVAFEEQKAQHAAQQFQQRFSRDQFVIEHSDKMGEEMVINAHNDLNQLMGGKHKIGKLDIDTFKTDSTKYLGMVKSARNDEEANKAINDYKSLAATHPIFNQIGQGQLKLMEDARSRKNLVHELEVLGIGNQHWREQIVGDGDPAILRDMVKNNDQRSMMMYQWSQDVMQRHENGGDVPHSDLSTAIGFLHAKGGGELKEGGKHIVEPLNRAQFHTEAINGLTEAQQVIKPLAMIADAITPEDRKALDEASNAVKTIAGSYDADKGVFSALGIGGVKHENDAVAKTNEIYQKYPQLAQTMKQLGPQAMEQEQVIKDQLEQLQRDKKATKAAVSLPNRTEHLERLDYQIARKKEQLEPWHAVAYAAQHPDSPEALKDLLGVGGRLTKALDKNEELRVQNLTEGEKNAKLTTDQARKSYHVDKAGPAFVEAAAYDWIAQNPNSTDEQRLGKLSEFGREYQKQHGLMPNLNEAAQRIVAARTSAEDNTATKLNAEQTTKFTMMEQGAENIKDYRTAITNPDGSYDMKLLMSQEMRFPWTDGRTVDTIILDVTDGRLRTESGATVTDSEVTRMIKRSRPLWTDDKATIDRKLGQMERFFEVQLDVMDPSKKLRSRISPAPHRTREDILGGGQIDAPVASIAPSDPKLGVAAYSEWRAKNPKADPKQFLAQGK